MTALDYINLLPNPYREDIIQQTPSIRLERTSAGIVSSIIYSIDNEFFNDSARIINNYQVHNKPIKPYEDT